MVPSSQSQYLVVPQEYVAVMHECYDAAVHALGHSTAAAAQRVACQEAQHHDELAECHMALEAADTEVSRLKQESLEWRKRAALYKLKLASKEEAVVQRQENITVLEGLLQACVGEREELLHRCSQLQQQLQQWSTVCQSQHRARVQEQVQLQTSCTEAHQYREQLDEAQGIMTLLEQQLADERSALSKAQDTCEELRRQLTQQQSEALQQKDIAASLREGHRELKAMLAMESKARAEAEARASKLTLELESLGAELDKANKRFERHVQEAASRDRQLAHEAQCRRQADEAVMAEKQLRIEQLVEQLEAARRAAAEELKRQSDRAERESRLRQEAEAVRQQLEDQRLREQRAHKGELSALRNQASDNAAEVEILQSRLAAAEKKAAAWSKQAAELQAELEHSTQHLSQQAHGKDATVVSLQSQLQQQQRKLEQREAELRDLQDAHGRQEAQLLRQVSNLKQQLADQAARAAEQEEGLRQQLEAARQQADTVRRQLESARQQVANVNSTDASLQLRLSELQDALGRRDERIQQLQLERQRLQGKQAELADQVLALQARESQLDRQLRSLGSPGPQHGHGLQVHTAAATVDKLMGNLLQGRGMAGGKGSTSAAMDEEEEDKGPSADFILTLSQQPLLSQGHRSSQQQGGPGEAALPAARGPAAAPPAENTGAAPAAAAGAPGGKRALGEPAEEKPSGKGRGRKAAKTAELQSNLLVADQGPSLPTIGEDAIQDGPGEEQAAGRYPSRRRAAQAGQAKAKAMATALADSEDEGAKGAETPGFVLKSEARSGHAQKPEHDAAASNRDVSDGAPTDVGPAGPSAAAAGSSGQQGTAAAAAADGAKNRSRAGKGGKAGQGKGAAAQQAVADDGGAAGAAAAAGPSGANGAAAGAVVDGAQGKKGRAAARQGPGASGRGAQAAKEDPMEVEGQPEDDVQLAASQRPTQEDPSQPPTQPQPRSLFQPQPAHAVQRSGNVAGAADGTGVGVAAGLAAVAAAPRPLASQLPASSQVSIFSQSLRMYEPQLAKNPLVALNPRVVEQAKNRMRLVPYTAIQQIKPLVKLVPPSVAKGQGAAQLAGAKRALPQPTQDQLAAPAPSAVAGEVMPPDVLLRSLQPQQAAAKGGRGALR